MDKFFDLLSLLLVCGTVLGGLLLVLLAMPSSQLRNFLVQMVGWAVTALCGVYVVSPIDIIPDFIPVIGWIDDAGALAAGITSGIMAYGAGQENKRLKNRY